MLLPGGILAQGDGPRVHLLAPTGVWGVNPRYLHLNQNLLPAGNILVSSADIIVDVIPTTFFHTFGIGDRFAQALLMINPGSVTGSVEEQIQGLPTNELSADGFSDGFVALKLGLVGAPALTIVEFPKHTP